MTRSYTCPTDKASCLTGCHDCPYESLKPVEMRRSNVPPEHPALKVLRALYAVSDLANYVYDIRENEGLGWEGPRVKAWGAACDEARKLLEKHYGTIL